MRISKKAEYALRALAAMARQPRSYPIQELSVQENIPVKFLEQILLTLRHGGLLTSKRGVGGGYTLRLPAAQITVAEVIQVVDGPLSPIACAAAKPSQRCSCPDPRTCSTRLLMVQVRQLLDRELGQYTLDDVIRMHPEESALAFDI